MLLPATRHQEPRMNDQLNRTAPRRRLPRRTRAAFIAAVLVLGTSVAGWTLLAQAKSPGAPAVFVEKTPAPVAPPPSAADRTIGASRDSYADVVSEVAPAVVTIRADRQVRAAQQFPFADDPFFRQFFGDRFRNMPQQPQEQNALGSGVVVRADGYILTNQHVVDGADQIKVELTDRRTFDAKLVGSDSPSDLALLKINATELHALPPGDSDSLRVGDVVLAVGNPLGLGQTVTMGIVSAKGRATGLTDGSFEDFIQTDAPINQGNSGGALVNTRGELVGINSQILSPSGGSIGIGFAIPATMAQDVMAQLVTNGRVRRGLLGVTVQGVTSDLAKSLGLSEVRGALVSAVQPDGPASRAGIERGDVIVDFNGRPVSDSNSLRNMVARTQPNSKATLQIVRERRRQTLTATLAELPVRGADAAEPAGREQGGRFGMAVEPMTPDVARQKGLGNARGLVVNQVTPAGPASEAGIRPGDVIKEVNHKPVASATELQAALNAAGDRPALLLLSRDGTDLFVALAPRRG
jgi:Do/DeqQ family serine protease